MYGKGVEKDVKEAYQLFSAGAEQKHPHSCNKLEIVITMELGWNRIISGLLSIIEVLDTWKWCRSVSSGPLLFLW